MDLETELRETRRALDVLSEVSREIAEARLDVDAVMATIVRSVAAHLGDACALWATTPAGAELILLAGDHRDPRGRALIHRMVGERVGHGVGVSGLAVQTRRAASLADLDPAQVLASVTDDRMRAYMAAFPPRHAAAAPLLSRGQVLGALSVSRLAGAPYSSIELWLLEELAARAASALADARQATELRRSREQLELVTQGLPALMAYVGDDLRYRWVNGAYERWFGVAREQVVARRLDEVLGPAALAAIQPYVDRVLAGEAISFESQVPYQNGSRWIRADYLPHHAPSGAVEGYVAMIVDITPERLLSDASVALAESLEWERTLHTVIDLAIPHLGEFGFFDVCEDDGEVRRVPLAKGDPRRQAILDQSRWMRSERTDLNLCALSSGASAIHPAIDDAWLRAVAVAPAHYEVMKDLAFASMLTVPLRYEGRVLGALTLFHTIESGRQHDAAALRLAEELASRAASAVENARLFREARRAIAVRDEFLSIAGHELRTPLTALGLQLELVARSAARGGPIERVASSAEKAVRHLGRFRALVDDLLDVSRITAGRLRLEVAEVALAEPVGDVLVRFADDLARAGCTLVSGLDRDVRGTWDRLRLEQIATNLLTNALKYGRGSPIEVTIERVGDRARLTVRDHGIGISPEDQARIFQRFERAVSAQHFGGLGLGLWIVNQLVAAHGGTIRVESAPGAGATFQVELPTRPPGSAP